MGISRISKAFAAVTALGMVGAASAASSLARASGDAPTGVTLTLWHNTADPDPILNLYRAYEAASGNTIELVDIPADGFENTTQTKWATGDRPDILEYHGLESGIQPLNPAANMIDLTGTPYIEKMGSLADVTGVIDGNNYAVSIAFPQVFGLYYNKQIFADAGLEPPQSYIDVAAACTTLQETTPDVAPIFEAGGSGWPQQLMSYEYMAEFNEDNAYGVAINEGTEQLADPDGPFIEALNFYVSMRDAGCFNEDYNSARFEDSINAVFNGTAAMVVQHSDMVTFFNDAAGGDTDLADSTVGFVGVSATQPVAAFIPTPIGTYYLPKTGDEEREAAARDFLDFITGDGYLDYVADAGAIPLFPGTTPPEYQGLIQDVERAWGNSTIFTSASLAGFNQFQEETQKLLAGQSTPEDVAEAMTAAMEQANAAGAG